MSGRPFRPRIAVIATGSAAGEVGGAERFYGGLRDALENAGADAAIHWETSDESSFAAIKRSYLRFYDCDLTAYDGVISTKAPGYAIRHRNHVCYLQHTMRVFYDMFAMEYGEGTEELFQQRRFIHTVDTAALRSPRTRRVFTIGHTVSDRLARYNGIDSEVLYQASTMGGLRRKESASGARYFFLPGRLHRWKRVDLAIEAMGHVKAPIELWISGTGEDEPAFRALAQKDSRIRFLGRVSDAELIDLYAGALAILFVPLQEDFGLVTLEAFLSGRPVITCEDSGEPARIVRHTASGFIVAPRPVELAVAMQTLATAPELSDAFGRQGAEDISSISWERVGSTLMAALGFQPQSRDRAACA